MRNFWKRTKSWYVITSFISWKKATETLFRFKNIYRSEKISTVSIPSISLSYSTSLEWWLKLETWQKQSKWRRRATNSFEIKIGSTIRLKWRKNSVFQTLTMNKWHKKCFKNLAWNKEISTKLSMCCYKNLRCSMWSKAASVAFIPSKARKRLNLRSLRTKPCAF